MAAPLPRPPQRVDPSIFRKSAFDTGRVFPKRTLKMTERSLAMKELDEVLDDLVTLLKNPEVGAELAAQGVNASLAIVGAEGLLAYVHGEKARAVEDWLTVAEEVRARLAVATAESETN